MVAEGAAVIEVEVVAEGEVNTALNWGSHQTRAIGEIIKTQALQTEC